MFDDEKTDAAFDFGYKALGQVVYFFQQLEDELRRAVSFLIEPSWDSQAADIVVTELSFKQLVHIGFSLLPLFKVEEPAKALAEWKAVLAAALRAEEHRNKILHSTFGVSIEEEPTFQRSKTTAKFKSGMKEVGEILDEKAVENTSSRLARSRGRSPPLWEPLSQGGTSGNGHQMRSGSELDRFHVLTLSPFLRSNLSTVSKSSLWP